MPEVFVQSFEHLRGFPREDEALTLLKKLASLVKPIMRKHGWRLPTLAEFFPEAPNLLDINMGQKILIRLRPAFDKGAFLQEHELLGTLLHELTHNVHGPHDQNFYKFLAGLEDELAALQRSGYAGEGFFTQGHRLGGGGGMLHNVPQHVARIRALQAAEQRRLQNSMLSGGGRLGGGDLATLGLSMRELTALAADMRAEDAKRCATGDKAREEEEVERAMQDSIRTAGFGLPDEDEVTVLDGPYRREPPSLPPDSSRPWPVSRSTRSSPPPINIASRPSQTDSSAWTCTTCTLINQGALHSCEALQTIPTPHSRSFAGDSPTWDCAVCGETGMEHEFWSCRWCGSVKVDSSRPSPS
ncbi:WLM domain-containing protein [Vararia minispora EC-137]|uniref:WLM domain-containing protein n=1 Tax=Vararia minispora EC-137 TaxID=1314806 RepID=A0ACB8QU21_9AGAM|nr:WLM domain-containing protein [Vararia minispora EC-137]